MILLFGITALTSAFLLFWVEPLFARMVLPLLGGSPAVWNTCLMYFQLALLGGYLYAHVLTRQLPVRRQAIVHVALLAAALFSLPIAIPAGWTPPISDRPIGWLLALLTITIGAPFLILSSTAPLVQRWFAELDSPLAANPYLLYAASNAGSFLGLFAFPVLLEPTLRLGQQSLVWSGGYVLALVLTAACAVVVFRHARHRTVMADATVLDVPVEPHAPAAPTLGDRLRWIALAFVPSSLLLGVTTYLTTDVAPVPFLWVVPLALYLLTFVVVFARPGRTAPRLPIELHALIVTAFILITFWDIDLAARWAYPLHLGVFTLTALVLHGELAASRPAPAHLTEFYLWLALGGALGGAFNALVAPVVFHSVAEYRPMVVLACFLRPSRSAWGTKLGHRVQALAAAAIPALLLAVTVAFGVGERHVLGLSVALVASLVAGAIVLALRASAWWFGASLAAVALAGFVFRPASERLLYADRSFFGTYRVTQAGSVHFLYHGTTIHGGQFVDSARRTRPVTYYHPDGPVGQFFDAQQDRLAGREIAVVGLGTGTLLCYSKPGQAWTYFEIDPLVERIARDPAYFTFLRDCPVRPRIVLGDARLTLAREPTGRYALLVLDAFSSDAIPVHLLTREAFALYRRVLAPDGLLLIHISNRHLKLAPVVASLAADAGLVARIEEHEASRQRELLELDYSCDWVALARRPEDLAGLANDPRWHALTAGAGGEAWSDDYSNVFRAIRWSGK